MIPKLIIEGNDKTSDMWVASWEGDEISNYLVNDNYNDNYFVVGDAMEKNNEINHKTQTPCYLWRIT